MSGRPDFLQRRWNFDTRGTFYTVCEKYFRLWPIYYSSLIILSHILTKLLSVSWKWIR